MADDTLGQGIHPSGGPVMTKQSMAAETDINNIVARHIAHDAPFFDGGRAVYGDFTGAQDYHASLNRLIQAQDEFSRLPASVRDFCDNDPGKFLDLVMDEKRRPELVKLGLVPEAVPAVAVADPPVSPPTPPVQPS